MNEKVIILYISETGDWGGAQKVILSLVINLDLKQYQPYVILGSHGLFEQTLIQNGIAVEIIPMRPLMIGEGKWSLVINLPKIFYHLIISVFKLEISVYKVKPNIIHTCSIQADLIGCILSRTLKSKLLWH
jgi:hypothetical protein